VADADLADITGSFEIAATKNAVEADSATNKFARSRSDGEFIDADALPRGGVEKCVPESFDDATARKGQWNNSVLMHFRTSMMEGSELICRDEEITHG
jgi:hypothetical protein